ncbi:hypothetical protein PS2_045070 [Malus domestica]
MNTTKVDKGHGGHFKVQNAAEFQNSPKVSKGGGPKAEAVVLRGARLARIFSKIWLTWRPDGVFQCNEILFAYVAEFEPSDHVGLHPQDLIIYYVYCGSRIPTSAIFSLAFRGSESWPPIPILLFFIKNIIIVKNHQADALNVETANSQSSKNKTWLLNCSAAKLIPSLN